MQLASAGSVTRAASGEFDARAALDEGLELKGAAFGTRAGAGVCGGVDGGLGRGGLGAQAATCGKARAVRLNLHASLQM